MFKSYSTPLRAPRQDSLMMLDALFGTIFRPQPVSPQIRQKDLQVLALGLSRTGTESLKKALETLGYDHVYHGFDFLKHPNQVLQWVPLLEQKIDGKRNFTASDFDAVIGHCEAVSDLPCSALYAELIDAYPKARIIVNYRKNVNDWYQSYAQTVDPLVTNWLYSFQIVLVACVGTTTAR